MTVAPVSDAVLRTLFAGVKRIAVLGYSSNTDRPSNHVATYLSVAAGYQVIGINPTLQRGVDDASGVETAPSLEGIAPVDVIDVFRRSDALPEVYDEIARLPYKPRAVWLQEGVVHAEMESALRAKLGIDVVVSDRCILKEHQRLS